MKFVSCGWHGICTNYKKFKRKDRITMNQNKIIFVAGAGLIGSGIAQTAISSGFPVILYDVLWKF